MCVSLLTNMTKMKVPAGVRVRPRKRCSPPLLSHTGRLPVVLELQYHLVLESCPELVPLHTLLGSVERPNELPAVGGARETAPSRTFGSQAVVAVTRIGHMEGEYSEVCCINFSSTRTTRRLVSLVGESLDKANTDVRIEM